MEVRMKKFTHCLKKMGTGIIIFAVLFIFQAQAQTPETDLLPVVDAPLSGNPIITDTATDTPEATSAPETGLLAKETAPPPEVLQDTQISAEDLGAVNARIKPGNFFHPFKQFGRDVQEFFTFDPVKNAELKLKHANQELSEIQQLVEEKGIENINPKILTNSVDWFENKMENIKNASEKIKGQKTKNPEGIEELLNNLTDKQIKEHKILEKFNEGITENKEKIVGAEDAFAALKDVQSNVLKHFGEILTNVDEQEKIPARLSAVANEQQGSEFKLIKTTEILKKLQEQAPEETKDAIKKAQTKTMELLQEDMKAMPAVVRAEKFKTYTNALPGNETIQLSVFEDLKQLPNIPQDILKKIEEVKEFAVKRFEEKAIKFKQPEVQEKFFEDLKGDSLDDIMVLEELKAKITAKQESLKKKVEQKNIEGMEKFKKKFTDAQSQEQAKQFEKLVKEMTANPNPKTLKLISELETQVAQDPEKKAFIEEIKTKTKAEMETKFRMEGERFFDRMSSLNPEDMMVFQKMEQDQFYDPMMIEQFSQHQTNRFKEYVQGIDNTENFDRFNKRFGTEVVQIIKTKDTEFSNVMQFKSRKIAEAEMQLKENEARMKMELEWKKSENDFQMKLRRAANDEAKKALYEEKRQKELSLVDQEFETRKKMMQERIKFDPFCDEICQVIQKQFLEQDSNYRKQNIMEDARMREFEMELRTQPAMGGGDPFQGKCQSPETCMKFCKENLNFSACQMLAPMQMQMPPQTQPVEGQMPQNIYANNPMYGPPPCPPGQINMPKGSGQWVCTDDPYQKISETFKKCPPGYNWNDIKAFCEFNQVMFKTSCPQGEYWDEGKKTCIRPGMPQACPPSQYWDPGKQACVSSGQNPCPPNQYWDAGKNGCAQYKTEQACPQGQYWDSGLQTCRGQQITQPMPVFCGPGESWDNIRGCVRENFQQCGPGEYFDFYEKRCKTDQWKSCPSGEYWDQGRNSCIRDMMAQPVEQCAQGYFWDFYKKQCVKDMYAPPPPVTPPQACPAVMPRQCNPGETPTYGNCGPSCTIQSATPSCPSGQWWSSSENRCAGGATPTPITGGCASIIDKNVCMSKPECGVWCSGDPNPCYGPGRTCGGSGTCGNKICEGNETTTSCPSDCGGTPPPSGGVCGNGTCESSETMTSCPSDCGTTNSTCPSTIYNNYTTGFACNYSNCPNGCIFDYKGCPNGCITSTTICGNGVCDNGETTTSCPSDCGGTPPPSGGVCGNGTCESNETMTSCPSDCGNVPPPGSILQAILNFFKKLFSR
ncbi:MAG: hypothetical protein Athens101410_72 [Parcubacteria group bacterium Athens1014_10]|nr:MAG: hypothetical protein Athens101410_72 [Parcubacteria group bacterium Athens1014_10]TSD06098.1 MAG: hypothetical protein Athens071412_72 [Parcubacteria group bacterium Athens0714_12]